jgi:hypothetical protein
MVERFESRAIIAGAILLDYPKLSIEQIVQMLESGLPAFVRTHAVSKNHPTHRPTRPTIDAAVPHR